MIDLTFFVIYKSVNPGKQINNHDYYLPFEIYSFQKIITQNASNSFVYLIFKSLVFL